MSSELHCRGLQAKFDPAATPARAFLFPCEVGHLRRVQQYLVASTTFKASKAK